MVAWWIERGDGTKTGLDTNSPIQVPAEMKAEERVVQSLRYQFDETDLTLHADTRFAVFDLTARQTRFVQQRCWRNPGLPRTRIGKPGYRSRGARDCAEVLPAGGGHETGIL
jgi:hypothetical protein